MKKLLSAILVIALLVSVLSVTALADGTVTLTVGEGKQFATLEAAFEEAIARKYTDITYGIYGKNTITNEIDNQITDFMVSVCDDSTTQVKFMGMDSAAEIFIDDNELKTNYNNGGTTTLTAHDADVSFENLIINHNKNTKNPLADGTYDRHYKFWYFISGDNQTYKNCTFLGNILSFTKNVVFENCFFINTAGGYALFYRGNGMDSTLKIDGCDFKGPRAIKLFSDKLYKVENYQTRAIISELTIKNSIFAVTDKTKAAIENTDTVKSDVNLVYTGNTFKNCNAVNDAESIGTTLADIYKNNKFVVERPGAADCFIATTPVYEKGGEVISGLVKDDITAKVSVKNEHNLDLPISVITTEYVVSPDGVKTMLQLKKDTKLIKAGQTEDFSNTLKITETQGHYLQTIIIANDVAEPVAAATLLSPGVERAVFLRNETGDNDIIISVYQINRE